MSIYTNLTVDWLIVSSAFSSKKLIVNPFASLQVQQEQATKKSQIARARPTLAGKKLLNQADQNTVEKELLAFNSNKDSDKEGTWSSISVDDEIQRPLLEAPTSPIMEPTQDETLVQTSQTEPKGKPFQ